MELNQIHNLNEIIQMGKKMIDASHSPYSSFRVGAVAVTEDGQAFPGCNVENASYSLAVCAEVSSICRMVASGRKKLAAIFVFSHSEQFVTPCGGCRQTILEFSGNRDTPIYTVNNKGEIRKHQLSILIPYAFNSYALSEEANS